VRGVEPRGRVRFGSRSRFSVTTASPVAARGRHEYGCKGRDRQPVDRRARPRRGPRRRAPRVGCVCGCKACQCIAGLLADAARGQVSADADAGPAPSMAVYVDFAVLAPKCPHQHDDADHEQGYGQDGHYNLRRHEQKAVRLGSRFVAHPEHLPPVITRARRDALTAASPSASVAPGRLFGSCSVSGRGRWRGVGGPGTVARQIPWGGSGRRRSRRRRPRRRRTRRRARRRRRGWGRRRR
jgi:hypothetical protein